MLRWTHGQFFSPKISQTMWRFLSRLFICSFLLISFLVWTSEEGGLLFLKRDMICWRFVFIFPLLSKAAATNWQINHYQSIQIRKKLLLINQGLFYAWRLQPGFCWSCLKMSCHFHPYSHFLEMWTDSWTRFWSESQSLLLTAKLEPRGTTKPQDVLG